MSFIKSEIFKHGDDTKNIWKIVMNQLNIMVTYKLTHLTIGPN